MPLKNKAGGVYLYAVDTAAAPYGPKTGDAANITGSCSLDGGAETAGFGTAHPTEIGGGLYWQPLTAAETNANQASYRWTSSTTGISIQPTIVNYTLILYIKKNTALAGFPFPMLLADHSTPATGKTISAYRSLDGGAFGACANAAAEIVDATRPGWYTIDLAAGDLNGSTVALNFANADCDTTQIAIVTQP